MRPRRAEVSWEFVEYIPSELNEGVIYIAPQFGAVIHLCLEGCGERISTPLSLAQWSLTFDGETVSLWPSVGNWGLPCRSHYIVRKNQVIWASQWSDAEIVAGARDDRRTVEALHEPKTPERKRRAGGIWELLRRVFRRS